MCYTFYTGIINKDELDNLVNYMKKILDKKAYDIKMTNRLESHPCVVTVQDMASARHFIRMQSHQMNEEMRYSILQPRFEINPNHPLMKKLCKLTTTDTELADRLIQQVCVVKKTFECFDLIFVFNCILIIHSCLLVPWSELV